MITLTPNQTDLVEMVIQANSVVSLAERKIQAENEKLALAAKQLLKNQEQAVKIRNNVTKSGKTFDPKADKELQALELNNKTVGSNIAGSRNEIAIATKMMSEAKAEQEGYKQELRHEKPSALRKPDEKKLSDAEIEEAILQVVESKTNASPSNSPRNFFRNIFTKTNSLSALESNDNPTENRRQSFPPKGMAMGVKVK